MALELWYHTIDYQNHHFCRFLILSPIWKLQVTFFCIAGQHAHVEVLHEPRVNETPASRLLGESSEGPLTPKVTK